MTRRFWTDLELELLRQAYADYTTEAIATVLGRTVEQVYSKAGNLGLKKSEAYMASPAACRLRRGNEVGKAFRFKKGQTPFNKGAAGWNAGGRSHETRFKPGRAAQDAHNYVPIGSTKLSKDGYLVQKTTDDPSIFPARRWVAVHRLVWEATNGPIPDKHIVVFRRGMRTTVFEEITLDRVECISLVDNMRRNSLHRYPKEIAHAIQMRGALNRRINHVEKHQRPA